MTLASPKPFNSRFRRSAVAMAMLVACASASALPTFTLDPGPLLTTSPVTVRADNILISDFAKIVLSGTSFSESGYLAVTGFELGGNVLTGTGLNIDYGMYFQFNGKGIVTSTNLNPVAGRTFGDFTSLEFTLYGYKGAGATFGISNTNDPFETASGEIVLATGRLISGDVNSAPEDGLFRTSAGAKVTFDVAPTAGTFFAEPNPFYNMSFATFSNSSSQVKVFSGGFNITQGGGSVNFAAPIPEPETYALMLAGLGAVAFVARRRRRID